MEERDVAAVKIDTVAGVLVCSDAGDGKVTVDMGRPELGWAKIPLAKDVDTNRFAFDVDGQHFEGSALATGNPHCVLFVDDADAAPVSALGPKIEHHAMFPARVNVEFATVKSRSLVRMRVWERGVGITSACGTGACATAVAAMRRGLTDRKVDVVLDGGTLTIEWTADDHILMTGPATLAYRGDVDLAALSA
jgi:diaminopimelate epimerase